MNALDMPVQVRCLLLGIPFLLTAACGGGGGGGGGDGGGGGGAPAPTAFELSVTVSGLSGQGLVIEDGTGRQQSVSANGVVRFGTLAAGRTYSVAVTTQPASPSQSCTVTNGSGTMGTAAVTASVQCETRTFAVGGTVSGMIGTGLRLRNSGGDELAVSANGSFRFPTAVRSGDTYAVSVATQPGAPTQVCAVSAGQGTVGSADVTAVLVDCTTPITSQNYASFGRIGQATGETLLQMTEFIGLRLAFLSSNLSAMAVENCIFPGDFQPGRVDYTFTDADSSAGLSAGDRITLDLTNCTTESLNGKYSGRVELTLKAPPPLENYRLGFAATAQVAAFVLGNHTLNGRFDVTYLDAPERRRLQADVASPGLSIVIPLGVGTSVVRAGRMTKSIDYSSARYEVSLAGSFEHPAEFGRFTLSAPAPVVGWVSTYPDAGVQEYRSGSSVARIAAQNIPQNSAYAVTLSPDGVASSAPPIGLNSWSFLSPGYLWWESRSARIFSGLLSSIGIWELRNQLFVLMNATPFVDPSNYTLGSVSPTTPEITLFFSAPVDATRTRMRFVPPPHLTGSVPAVDATLTVNGAMVTVTSAQPLQPNTQYYLTVENGTVFTPIRSFGTSFNPLKVTTRPN